jgi:pimeloyl-ACP methyl ester carboxylesterase
MSAAAVTHPARMMGRDADLAWSATGKGTPLLLIAGLGLDGDSWWRSIPGFAERFRVITFDYRGVGRSGSAPMFCTTDNLADDAVAVLDEAGVQRVFVYGFSLGGMVAQRLALRHPDRVSALVLGATQAGGTRAVQPGAATLAWLWMARFLSSAAVARSSVPHVYGERCRRETPERIVADLEQRRRRRLDPQAYRGQIAAAMMHDAHDSLRTIETPTLVVHGASDRLIPKENSELIAREIPDARLHLIPHAGHYYSTDEPSIDGVIADFFARGDVRPTRFSKPQETSAGGLPLSHTPYRGPERTRRSRSRSRQDRAGHTT